MADESKSDHEPKIVTDEDWKQQAKREKERLAAEDAKKAAKAGKPGKAAAHGSMPPGDFLSLVNTLMLQALYALGKVAGHGEEPPPVDLELAQYHIDTLGMLEEKTKGNLTAQESRTLTAALQELRMQYVNTAKG
jgi:hypothetical protein